VVWQCATETDRIFEVVPAWSDDERRDAFASAGFFIGQMLTVSFCGRTAAGVPRRASGVAVRAAEDMSNLTDRRAVRSRSSEVGGLRPCRSAERRKFAIR
jgi:hypothetical protein